MAVFVGFLRGINVGGHRKIKMADLKNVLLAAGLVNPVTYLQSGNIIFESDDLDTTSLQRTIEESITGSFGFKVPVLVHSKKEFRSIFLNNPFANDPKVDKKNVYFILLKECPDPANFERITSGRTFDEEMSLSRNVIYMNYVKGYGRSVIGANFFERKLDQIATARNYNTMRNLNEKLQ